MMVCCKCNRSGKCSSCICRSSGRTCSNCLPGRLGKCLNGGTSEVDSNEDLSLNGDVLSSVTNNPLPAEDAFSRLSAIVNSAQVEITHPAAAAVHTTFSWGSLDGDEFIHKLEEIYEVVVCWKRNLFLIPSGRSGKAFVDEVAGLFKCYAEGDALESIALKASMVVQTLVLQKSSLKSRTLMKLKGSFRALMSS